MATSILLHNSSAEFILIGVPWNLPSFPKLLQMIYFDSEQGLPSGIIIVHNKGVLWVYITVHEAFATMCSYPDYSA